MCDKMAISAYILKIVEKDPFLGFKWELRKCLIVTNFFSTNKQYLKQNETNRWSSFWWKRNIGKTLI